MFQKIVEIERRIQQLRRFEQGLKPRRVEYFG
jgi:hypothetical protein